MFKSLLLAGLLAGPMLAFNTMAQNREDIHWSPVDIFTDGSGNQYAYWDDANNSFYVLCSVRYESENPHRTVCLALGRERMLRPGSAADHLRWGASGGSWHGS